MKKIISIVLLCGLIFTVSACSTDKTTSSTKVTTVADGTTVETAKYHKITAEEAKKQLDENEEVILVDVRTQSEFDEKHIKGALLIPDNEIVDSAETMLPNKDATILLYCRSGRRSKAAAEKLVELGYTNIYDFGGINDYPYDTVSE